MSRFKKIMLLSYEIEEYQALNADGWGYRLTIKVSTWWGLKTRIVKVTKVIPDNINVHEFYEPKLNVWL